MTNIFGKGKETIQGKEWDWGSFNSTEGFPVSDNLLDWVIGQDKALEECNLCLDEWVHKLKWMKEEQWYKAWEDPNSEKPNAKKFILECEITTVSSYVKTFYIIFKVNENLAQQKLIAQH